MLIVCKNLPKVKGQATIQINKNGFINNAN